MLIGALSRAGVPSASQSPSLTSTGWNGVVAALPTCRARRPKRRERLRRDVNERRPRVNPRNRQKLIHTRPQRHHRQNSGLRKRGRAAGAPHGGPERISSATSLRRTGAGLALEAKVVVVEIADGELANLPRPVLDELAHQPDRFPGLSPTAHLGLQLGADRPGNRQQATCPPFLVQPVHRRRLDIDLGVVPERLELGAGPQMNPKSLTLRLSVAGVVLPNVEAEPLVEPRRRLEAAYREDRRRAPEPDHSRSLPARHGPRG